MKSINIFFILLLVSSLAYADVGSCHCLKVTIKTKKNTLYKGYFSVDGDQVKIGNVETGYYYFSEDGSPNSPKKLKIKRNAKTFGADLLELNNNFFSYVLSKLFDTILVYPEVAFILDNQENGYSVITAYMGKKTSLVPSNIASIIIHSINPCSYYGNVDTHLSIGDTWVTGKIHHNRILQGSEEDVCLYKAFFFGTETSGIISLLKEYEVLNQKYKTFNIAGKYDSKKLNEIAAKYNLIVEKLRKERVIIVSYCAC